MARRAIDKVIGVRRPLVSSKVTAAEPESPRSELLFRRVALGGRVAIHRHARQERASQTTALQTLSGPRRANAGTRSQLQLWVI
jgi:hypothetical protein